LDTAPKATFDGQRPVMPRRDTLNPILARLVRCLAEIQRRNTVSIAVIIGDADALSFVGLVAEIVPDHPGAGSGWLTLAAARLPIAQVQGVSARLDQTPLRFAARRQSAACSSGFKAAVADAACHRSVSNEALDTGGGPALWQGDKASCPTDVQ